MFAELKKHIYDSLEMSNSIPFPNLNVHISICLFRWKHIVHFLIASCSPDVYVFTQFSSLFSLDSSSSFFVQFLCKSTALWLISLKKIDKVSAHKENSWIYILPFLLLNMLNSKSYSNLSKSLLLLPSSSIWTYRNSAQSETFVSKLFSTRKNENENEILWTSV